MKEKNNLKGSAILLIASFIWGLAFVVQNDATDKIKPFLFNSMRSVLGAAVLGIYLLIWKRIRKRPIFPNDKEYKKNAAVGGLLCGIFLALSINFQQIGISVYPESAPAEARAGFITALYVVMVPLVAVFIKKKVPLIVWGAVLVATAGVYLLCFSGGPGGFYLGDGLMLLCALSCTVHIILVDKYAGLVGGTRLSMIQFAVCGIISGILSVIFEPEMTVANIYSAAPQILYMGILSSGVAYTLQIIGQKYAEPAVASISMSFESVFATLGGWLITGANLSIREFFGCALVFVAIITAQIPELLANKKKKVN